MTDLSRHAAIVTGAAGDIGRAIATRLAGAGCRVAALDRDAAALERAFAGSAIDCFACDVADAQATQDAVAAVAARFGRLSILVNNAATVTASRRVADLTPGEWLDTLNVNLTGAWLMVRAAMPHLIDSRGVVLNVASQLGHVAAPGRGAYGASKAGLIALTRAIAIDYAEAGVRAVSLSPGAVLTSRLRQRYGSAEAACEALSARYPAGRLGTIEEVAQAALFLVGDGASFITGNDLLVDGGYTST